MTNEGFTFTADNIDDWPYTPPVETFMALEEKNRNLWYMVGSGHHRNLFDAAWDEVWRLRRDMQRLQNERNEHEE